MAASAWRRSRRLTQPIANAMARAVARPTRMPVKPPGPHDTAIAFNALRSTPVD